MEQIFITVEDLITVAERANKLLLILVCLHMQGNVLLWECLGIKEDKSRIRWFVVLVVDSPFYSSHVLASVFVGESGLGNIYE